MVWGKWEMVYQLQEQKRGLGFKDNGVQDTGRAILKEKSRLERFRFGDQGTYRANTHLDRLFS